MADRITYRFAGLALLALLAGCGGSGGDDLPELTEVTGQVTMAGQPLQDAIVTFDPREGGSMSAGVTDASGRFELYYSQEHKGAVIGQHTVTISKMEGEAGDELIPAKYNEQSQLTEQVTEGSNDITIELE